MRRKRSVYVYYIIIVLLIAQPLLETSIFFFKYYDEVLSITLFTVYVFNVVRTGKIRKEEWRIIQWLIVLLIIGIIGNVISKSDQSIFAILTDIVSNLKLYLFFLPFVGKHIDSHIKSNLEDWLSTTIRTIILIMFICLIISQFIDIGMTDEIRYGFKTFNFLLTNAAGLNTYFYVIMVVFSATLQKNGRIRKHTTLYLVMSLITWMSTLRSRAIAFSILYMILYWFLMVKNIRKAAFTFKWYYMIPIVALAVMLGWSTFEDYFLVNTREARYVLLRGAINIAKDYMPFGSGFATFGTAASKIPYSSIYERYGMANVWGLGKNSAYFILDQYWCGILGQFGLAGTIVIGLLIYKFYKITLRRCSGNVAHQLAALTMIYTSMLASVAAATYVQSSILASVCTIMLLSDGKNGKPKD